MSNLKLAMTSFLSKINKTHIIIIVAVIIIAEAIWAYMTIKPISPYVPIAQNQQQTVSIVPSTIALTAPKTDVKIGEIIPVSINVSSAKKTDGVDLIIRYDPNLLTVMPYKEQAPMQIGTLYGDYPVNKFIEKDGLITVSGVNNGTMGIVPQGLLGTILFKPKATGTAKIFIDFTKGSTIDSNITETQTSKDILDSVGNLEIKITR